MRRRSRRKGKQCRRRRNSKTRSKARHGEKRNLDERTKAKKKADRAWRGESVILSHSELVKLVLVMCCCIEGLGGQGEGHLM